MKCSHRQESGFTLVSAIFLIVVLAALGAYMVTISGVQRTTTTHTILAARVYFGAKSGLEWAISQTVQRPPVFCTVPANAGDPPITTAFPTFSPNGTGLGGVNVTVICTATKHREAKILTASNDPFYTYYITSTAEYGNYGEPDYTRRRLEASVSDKYGPP